MRLCLRLTLLLPRRRRSIRLCLRAQTLVVLLVLRCAKLEFGLLARRSRRETLFFRRSSRDFDPLRRRRALLVLRRHPALARLGRLLDRALVVLFLAVVLLAETLRKCRLTFRRDRPGDVGQLPADGEGRVGRALPVAAGGDAASQPLLRLGLRVDLQPLPLVVRLVLLDLLRLDASATSRARAPAIRLSVLEAIATSSADGSDCTARARPARRKTRSLRPSIPLTLLVLPRSSSLHTRHSQPKTRLPRAPTRAPTTLHRVRAMRVLPVMCERDGMVSCWMTMVDSPAACEACERPVSTGFAGRGRGEGADCLG
ncbi:hypothetical protein AAT19DRAFT_9783 [Rhodotorula toruloides]|uniref:Uncharacterized protein n=1 Tax=Rhodotorula toruloides TaxID=5286 RepID=A0A2T0A0W8_RHOTO|nr:hypothetical protein AAT19DRAFT_9783 [Rhodotorula toruloides]